MSWAPTRKERPGTTSIVRVVWHARGTAEHGQTRCVRAMDARSITTHMCDHAHLWPAWCRGRAHSSGGGPAKRGKPPGHRRSRDIIHELVPRPSRVAPGGSQATCKALRGGPYGASAGRLQCRSDGVDGPRRAPSRTGGRPIAEGAPKEGLGLLDWGLDLAAFTRPRRAATPARRSSSAGGTDTPRWPVTGSDTWNGWVR